METSDRDYGWNGRLGLGTPQANPTVEAEMRRLIPPSVEYFTLRLTSSSDDPRQRLIDYITDLPDFVRRYAGLQVDNFLFACTGSSYLVDDSIARSKADMAANLIGAPIVLAADAIADSLHAINAQRIALLSPYPDWLHEPAMDYWTRQGFEIAAHAQVDIGSADTYQIYEQQSRMAMKRLGALRDIDVDAFLFSGTGMPSLPIIKQLREDGHRVISSNLALATLGLELIDQQITAPDNWTFKD